MLWVLLLFIIIFLCVYYFLVRPYYYWLEKGVLQDSIFEILGANWGPLLRTRSFPEVTQKIYNLSSKTRYMGMFQFFLPTLVIRDPDLIRQITVKDFDYFTDHHSFIPEKIDPLWDNNLFALTGYKWRDMRAILSPAFTSKKMKFMFALMAKNGEEFVKFFSKKNQNLIIVEMKDVFTRFANDVIANTAFGLPCDSLSERENEFYLMGKEATNCSGFWKSLKFLGYQLVPSLFQVFNVKLFSDQVSKFFNDLVKINISSREKLGLVRPDMTHLLMEAREGGLHHHEDPEDLTKNPNFLTNQDIVSQAMAFFVAGFDTISGMMCFMAHELAINPEIQLKLLEEVDEVLLSSEGTITYEALFGMKYLDMVISETLRKWPINVAIDRVCTKPYVIEPTTPEERKIFLEKYDKIWVPVFAMHRDPELFPEPEIFDPERFNDLNKTKIQPYTYLPFGCGPRNCIGSRFAVMEAKIVFLYLLSEFEIVPTEKTQIPLEICKKQFSLNAEKGFWLALKRRVKL